MDIITKLEGLENPRINRLLERLFGSSNLDVRMKICDDIIIELELMGLPPNSDVVDEIRDLAIS